MNKSGKENSFLILLDFIKGENKEEKSKKKKGIKNVVFNSFVFWLFVKNVCYNNNNVIIQPTPCC